MTCVRLLVGMQDRTLDKLLAPAFPQEQKGTGTISLNRDFFYVKFAYIYIYIYIYMHLFFLAFFLACLQLTWFIKKKIFSTPPPPPPPLHCSSGTYLMVWLSTMSLAEEFCLTEAVLCQWFAMLANVNKVKWKGKLHWKSTEEFKRAQSCTVSFSLHVILIF